MDVSIGVEFRTALKNDSLRDYVDLVRENKTIEFSISHHERIGFSFEDVSLKDYVEASRTSQRWFRDNSKSVILSKKQLATPPEWLSPSKSNENLLFLELPRYPIGKHRTQKDIEQKKGEKSGTVQGFEY